MLGLDPTICLINGGPETLVERIELLCFYTSVACYRQCENRVAEDEASLRLFIGFITAHCEISR